VQYVSPGYLLFLLQGSLMAQRFDPDRLELAGEPVRVADQVANYALLNGSLAAFSASEKGVLAGKPASSTGVTQQLIWYDRAGAPLETLGEMAEYSNPALSPDRAQLAVARRDTRAGTRDLWTMDLSRGVMSRFTFDADDDLNPVWTPDGQWIVFTSNRKGVRDIYRRPSSGAGEDELLLESSNPKNLEHISPDGRYLIFNETESGDPTDLMLLSLDGDREVTTFLATDFTEDQAQFSPDGRWVAYRSSESGSSEVYVRPFAPDGGGTGGQWQVSLNGGVQPQWRADGKELFYISDDGTLMAVDVNTDSSAFSAGIPTELFRAEMEAPNTRRNNYLPSADGQRFLVNTLAEDASTSSIEVLVNWTALLEQSGQ